MVHLSACLEIRNGAARFKPRIGEELVYPFGKNDTLAVSQSSTGVLGYMCTGYENPKQHGDPLQDGEGRASHGCDRYPESTDT
jgi:hypothetical protein